MALTPFGELPSNARVTVDSAPIIYFLEDHSKLAARFAPVFDAAAQGALSIFVSTITVAEVVAGPLKAGNEILAAQYCEALRGCRSTWGARSRISVTRGRGSTATRCPREGPPRTGAAKQY